MKIENDVLRSAFAIVDHVPPGALESSMFVRLQTGKRGCSMALTGVLHSEAALPIEADSEERTIYIDRKLLRSVINSAVKDVDVKVGAESVIFKSGKCRVEAPQRQIPGGYGIRPKGEGVPTTLLERTLAHLKMMVQYTPKPPNDPHLAAILITGTGIYASDGFNMVAVKEKTGLKATFRLPVELAVVANQLNVPTIKTVNGVSILDTTNGMVCRTLNADLERYPEEMMVANVETERKAKASVRLPGKEFCDALSMLRGFGAGDHPVKLSVNKGEVKCQLQLVGPTRVEYTLKINEATGSISTTFYLNPMRVWAEYVNADTNGEAEFEFHRIVDGGALCVRAESGGSEHFLISAEDQDGAVDSAPTPEVEPEQDPAPKAKTKAVAKKAK